MDTITSELSNSGIFWTPDRSAAYQSTFFISVHQNYNWQVTDKLGLLYHSSLAELVILHLEIRLLYCLSLRPAGLDYKLNLISDINFGFINPLLFLVIATFKPYLSYSPFTFITLVVILSCHTKIPVLCCYGVSITKEFNWQAGEAQCSDCEKKQKKQELSITAYEVLSTVTFLIFGLQL